MIVKKEESKLRQFKGVRFESQLGSFPEACFALTLAIHRAPKREAFVCRDAPSRLIRDRRSRQLVAEPEPVEGLRGGEQRAKIFTYLQ